MAQKKSVLSVMMMTMILLKNMAFSIVSLAARAGI
jgi:hypothetical protein